MVENHCTNKYEQPYCGPYCIQQVNTNGTVCLKMGAVMDTVNIKWIPPFKTSNSNHGGECSMHHTHMHWSCIVASPEWQMSWEFDQCLAQYCTWKDSTWMMSVDPQCLCWYHRWHPWMIKVADSIQCIISSKKTKIWTYVSRNIWQWVMIWLSQH